MKLSRINSYFLISLIASLTTLKGIQQTELKKFQLKIGHVKFVGEPEYDKSQLRTMRAAVDVDSLSSIRPWTSTFNQTLTSFTKRRNTISYSKSDSETISNTVSMHANQVTNPNPTPAPKPFELIIKTAQTDPTNSTSAEPTSPNQITKLTTALNQPVTTNTQIAIENAMENTTVDNRRTSSSLSHYVINLTVFTTFSKSSDGGSQPVSHEEIAHKRSWRKITNAIHHELMGQPLANASDSSGKRAEKAITRAIHAPVESFPDLSTISDDEIFAFDENLSHSNDTGSDNETSENENLTSPDPDSSERIQLSGLLVAEERFFILTAGCVIPVALSTIVLIALGWKRYRNQSETATQPELLVNSPIRRYP